MHSSLEYNRAFRWLYWKNLTYWTSHSEFRAPNSSSNPSLSVQSVQSAFHSGILYSLLSTVYCLLSNV